MVSGPILQGIGAGISTVGGIASSIGDMKSKNKARKARLQQLNQGMKDFTLGSQDAQGNQINFNNKRGWGFDLSGAGKAERNLANKGAYSAVGLAHMSPSQARNQLSAQDFKASRNQALANQAAANRSALRTGSSLGNVQRSFGNIGSSALQRAMQENLRAGNAAHTARLNDLAQTAMNMKQPLVQTQQGLLNLQNGPAVQQLALRQAMADAAGIPKTNWAQTLGSIGQGIGSAIGGYGKNSTALDEAGKNRQFMEKMMQMFGG